MPHRFQDRTITRTADLFDFMEEDQHALCRDNLDSQEKPAPSVWYRGLPSSKYKLLPTLHRYNIPVDSEADLMNRFKQNAHEFLEERPQGEWEWMLLARHHGLPSRLLDWTENPLVGLFFASEANRHKNNDGILWCLSPQQLHSAASRRDPPDGALPMLLDEEEPSPSNELLSNYRTSRVSQTSDEISVPPAPALSIRTNKRIQAQLGVFTIHHADRTPLERWGDRSHLWKLIVPKACKTKIQGELRRVGITSLTLFPQLDNVALEAKRDYSA